MMNMLVRATEIKNFYVWTKLGLNFFKERLEFGEEIDVSNLSVVVRQNLCDQRLIGTREQVEQSACKIGIILKPIAERKESRDSNDTQENLIVQEELKNVNLRGKKK